MGWSVVEPLSPGVFQIDPSVYGAEHSRVFNVGGGAGGKKTAKAVALAAVKKLKNALTATMEAAIKLKVGDDVALKMSDDMAKNIGDRAAKNVDTKFPGLKDEAMGPARRQNLINGEAKKLGKGYADNLVKGVDADDLAKGLDVDDVAGFNKWADDAAKLGDDVALTPAQKAAKKKAAKADTAAKLDDAGTGNNKGLSETQIQITRGFSKVGLVGVGMFGAYGLLLPMAEAAGGVVGDTGDTVLSIFNGDNCRDKVEKNYPSNPEVWSEKTEECESQAAFRTMMMGTAAVSLVGILGIVLITRLLPSKPEEEDESEE
tara:strand:- start:1594 stop:2544 length:951 start_codon:yes stop_codon:yes gene_type:complete